MPNFKSKIKGVINPEIVARTVFNDTQVLTLLNGKKVVFPHELPWLDTARSGFIPALEHFWNGRASARTDIIWSYVDQRQPG